MENVTSAIGYGIISHPEEGFDGGSNAEFAKFLSYSQRSCSEVLSQLYRALDRGHITQNEFDEVAALAQEVHQKSGGLIKRLRSR